MRCGQGKGKGTLESVTLGFVGFHAVSNWKGGNGEIGCLEGYFTFFLFSRKSMPPLGCFISTSGI